MSSPPSDLANPADLADIATNGALDQILHARFGHPAFRPSQREIVEHIAEGEDALVVMPTGAGKSLCYQLPALARSGTTLVISPLVALMKDQVDGLQAQGIAATFINSSISPDVRRQRIAGLQDGAYELVYVAPERFSPRFLEALQGVEIGLFAVDEAHCLSQWGHDFRPDYLRLGKVREALGHPPTVALTATATPRVQEDILKHLNLPDARRFITGFDRPNLSLEVIEVTSLADKIATIPGIIGQGPALIYCATRKNVDKIASGLQAAGIHAQAYHAGLDHEQRIRVQDEFMSGAAPIVVATNAFGMGVDKDNVRAVVHVDLPGSVEAYYQEIGRAGRDGKPSRVVLLFRESDRRTQEFFIRMGHPEPAQIHATWRALQSQKMNPVWISLDRLSDALQDPDSNPRTVASCLYVLQRAGQVRRINPTERRGRISLTHKHLQPKRPPEGLRLQVWEWLRSEGIRCRSDTLLLRPDVAADILNMGRDQFTGALRGLESRGWITYDPPERTGGIELLKPNEPLVLDLEGMRVRRNHEYGQLDKMVGYARSGCRRVYLLEYFGQTAPWDRCGDCDACRSGKAVATGPAPMTEDQAIVVRKLLSTVARMGKSFSPRMVAKVATGSKDKAVRAFRFERLPAFGCLRSFSTHEVELLISALVEAQALASEVVTRQIGGESRTYREVRMTDQGKDLLTQSDTRFEMVFPGVGPARHAPTRTPPAAGPAPDGDLVAQLKGGRLRLARAEDVPPYVIAPNRTLEAMASSKPTTTAALHDVHGMGPGRISKYGSAFLEAMAAWTQGG